MRNKAAGWCGLVLATAALTGCDRADAPEQTEKTAQQVEKQVDAEAHTLEEAADEAVKIQQEEIENSVLSDSTKEDSTVIR